MVQMIDGGSGSCFQVFDKNGSSLGAAVYLDNFVGSVGGAGDPSCCTMPLPTAGS